MELLDFLVEIGLTDERNRTDQAQAIAAVRQLHDSSVRLNEAHARLSTENIRLKNELRQLRDKQQGGNNTDCPFFLPSEFKELWEQFLKENLNSTFCEHFEQPGQAVAQVRQFCTSLLESARQYVDGLLMEQLRILGLKDSLREQLFKSELALLRNNWRELAWPQPEVQVPGAEDCEVQLSREQMHKIVAYMLLQEERLAFSCGSVEPFNKKEHICVQGFAKDGEEVLVLLGLQRGGRPFFKKGVMALPKKTPDTATGTSQILPLQEIQQPAAPRETVDEEPTKIQLGLDQIRYRSGPAARDQQIKQDENRAPSRDSQRSSKRYHDRVISLKEKIQSEIRSRVPLGTLKEEILRELMLKNSNYIEPSSISKQDSRKKASGRAWFRDESRPLRVGCRPFRATAHPN